MGLQLYRSTLSKPLRVSRTAPAAGLSRKQVRVRASAMAEVIHISDTWIMAGSAALALSVPVALGSVSAGRVQSVSPSDASILLASSGNIKLVDVRSRLEVKIEGLPLSRQMRKARVIHAPFNELRGGKLRPVPSFVDDILFAPGVNDQTTFIVMSSRGSETCRRAVAAISQVGKHDIYTVEGGFRAWQAAGLDTESAALMSGEFDDAGGSSVLGGSDEEAYDYYGDGGSSSGGTSTVTSVDVSRRNAAGGGGAGGGGGGGAGAAALGVEEMYLDGAVAAGNNGPLAALTAAISRVPFKPKLLDVLKEGYTAADFKRDAMAGLVVGVIALALGMALGIASDSTPAVGVYTVVVGGLLASALSGSRVTIVGPTAAFIPIVAGVAHNYGFGGLAACTAIAGGMLMAMGATGMGGIIRYVPKPVVTGFTAGIATYIFGTQIKDFLGLGAPGRLPEGVPVPTEFLEKVIYLGSHLDATHVPSLAMAGGCLVLIKLWPKEWAKVVPQPIMAITAGTLALLGLQALNPGVDLGIETIGSHFGAGAIPQSLPSLQWPDGLTLETLPSLIYPATTIALLAAIESLLCARVSDGMIGDRHDSNTELISQGVANIACAAFGCLPATGALARTAANVRAGGRSPMSGIVHAAVVAAVVLAGAGPLAEHIPLPALSAVLVIVAVNMGEWHNFTELPKWPKNDTQLFLIAFSLTVLMDVAVAVAFGMAIALAIFVQDVSATMYVRALPPRSIITPPDHELPLLPGEVTAAGSGGGAGAPASPDPYRRASLRRAYAAGSTSQDEEDPVEGPQPTAAPAMASVGGAVVAAPASAAGGLLLGGAAAAANPAAAAAAGYLSVVPAGVVYVEVTGSLLFGAGEMLEKAVAATHTADPVQVLVLNLSRVPVVDVSGLEVLEDAAAELERAGKGLVVCGLTRQPLRMMARAGFLDMVGRENVCRGVQSALDRAAAIVAAKRAATKAAEAALNVKATSTTAAVNGGGHKGSNGSNGTKLRVVNGSSGRAAGAVAAAAAAAAASVAAATPTAAEVAHAHGGGTAAHARHLVSGGVGSFGGSIDLDPVPAAPAATAATATATTASASNGHVDGYSIAGIFSSITGAGSAASASAATAADGGGAPAAAAPAAATGSGEDLDWATWAAAAVPKGVPASAAGGRLQDGGLVSSSSAGGTSASTSSSMESVDEVAAPKA
ncbi:hypothetical protein HYH02_013991 [Chlamydomonas schloesseri]|uniref:STAS domain-containing protein n=1 Tax=Chlamydomonas schloesseri TaxID=2026947 RepID=A0A835SM00_9CHLO|nr:hypothetical protein HYH02_013991 [Chlamydomonas schloesseri]|eukprot:KAG2429652.1 hypothetical protein HYH02_013991 [Chlamydomonas schloesseri]